MVGLIRSWDADCLVSGVVGAYPNSATTRRVRFSIIEARAVCVDRDCLFLEIDSLWLEAACRYVGYMVWVCEDSEALS